jgi:putative membrane protein
MIDYNPKNWFTFIFRFHKADTFRKLGPLILSICIYTGIIAYIQLDWLHMKSNGKNIGAMHTILGLVISLLLVFRTNTAYDRWWEGRKHWGSLVNSSRNLAIKLNAMLDAGDQSSRAFFRQMIPAYASALKNHLRSIKEVETADNGHFDPVLLSQKEHYPNHISSLIIARINKLFTDKKISGHQLIILNPEMQSFSDICGACERIRNTPIPFSYSVFLKKFIFFYVMTLPFGFVFNGGYWAIPVVAFIFYVLASLELIAEEIEDPFGTDANDIPADAISDNIRKNVNEIFG